MPYENTPALKQRRLSSSSSTSSSMTSPFSTADTSGSEVPPRDGGSFKNGSPIPLKWPTPGRDLYSSPMPAAEQPRPRTLSEGAVSVTESEYRFFAGNTPVAQSSVEPAMAQSSPVEPAMAQGSPLEPAMAQGSQANVVRGNAQGPVVTGNASAVSSVVTKAEIANIFAESDRRTWQSERTVGEIREDMKDLSSKMQAGHTRIADVRKEIRDKWRSRRSLDD
ncbi:hypothetical protein L226DRAFT_576782 [Lentinus tigrinus ALCF2SS1-7]|uniref:Uncharacterized protein n=1 Tax=Lentinus tigrinus ALCF2SS1-6 TaxID=1328759 RepID=A0A5C2RKY1_9APHY|nr:hypothetical protein L227DRAFT_617999 [Lentinus tigrinus ALCF2SS1-6]RPD67978.1 hypothetical protein L226DRAFT_576782 [Lentinus tigrinus ALCF2SS1-7]